MLFWRACGPTAFSLIPNYLQGYVTFSYLQLTLLNAGRKYLGLNSLTGKVFLTAGLGGMSGAQAKASFYFYFHVLDYMNLNCELAVVAELPRDSYFRS